jgi:hypothetical protein
MMWRGCTWTTPTRSAKSTQATTLKTTVPFDVSKRAKPDYLLLKAGVWGSPTACG